MANLDLLGHLGGRRRSGLQTIEQAPQVGDELRFLLDRLVGNLLSEVSEIKVRRLFDDFNSTELEEVIIELGLAVLPNVFCLARDTDE